MTWDEERLQEAANARQLGDTRPLRYTDVKALLTDDFLHCFTDFATFADLEAALRDAGLVVKGFITAEEWNQSRVGQVLFQHSGFVTFGKMLAAAVIWAAEEGHWTDGDGDSAHIWDGSGRRR